MTRGGTEDQLAALAALGDATRRRLYLYVASRPEGAGREEAADATGISRALAAFHLDRLTADGLLIADYRRLSGRSGPGAGRPAKIYRRSEEQFQVTVPPRNYELLARLCVQAAATSGDSPSVDALGEAAHALGVSLGTEARAGAGPRPGREDLLGAAARVLFGCGFEATAGPRELVLRNCPFSPLSGEFANVVCAMNRSLMGGVVEGLKVKGIEAALDPREGRCCVVFRAPGASGDGPVSAPVEN
jgi:predicted ArsR family transcriptional regulator